MRIQLLENWQTHRQPVGALDDSTHYTGPNSEQPIHDGRLNHDLTQTFDVHQRAGLATYNYIEICGMSERNHQECRLDQSPPPNNRSLCCSFSLLTHLWPKPKVQRTC